jgi:hypothetical protein
MPLWLRYSSTRAVHWARPAMLSNLHTQQPACTCDRLHGLKYLPVKRHIGSQHTNMLVFHTKAMRLAGRQHSSTGQAEGWSTRCSPVALQGHALQVGHVFQVLDLRDAVATQPQLYQLSIVLHSSSSSSRSRRGHTRSVTACKGLVCSSQLIGRKRLRLDK